MNTVFLGLHVADVPVGLHWPATRAASMATIVDSSFAAIHRGTAIDAPASKQNLVLENSSFDASVTCAISSSDGCRGERSMMNAFDEHTQQLDEHNARWSLSQYVGNHLGAG